MVAGPLHHVASRQREAVTHSDTSVPFQDDLSVGKHICLWARGPVTRLHHEENDK
jgi:hypothetical protein